MKPVPTADPHIRVRPLELEMAGASAPLYAGAYEVTLNAMVTVVVVPETAVPVDRWDPDALPDDFDAITDPQIAYLSAAMSERYVVTTGEAPGVHRFRALGDEPGERTGVALVVDRAEFPRLSWDLQDMATFLGAVWPDETLSGLRGRPAIERIVELEDAMAPGDVRWLRDPQ